MISDPLIDLFRRAIEQDMTWFTWDGKTLSRGLIRGQAKAFRAPSIDPVTGELLAHGEAA